MAFKNMTDKRVCVIDGCNNPYRSKGYCNKHYQHWKIYGDAEYDTQAARFWAKVDKKEFDECWLWKGPVINSGYGTTRTPSGFKTTAHRATWEWVHGVVLSVEVHVCHTCDNRLCVNPNHLFLGTREENMKDMVAKGRSPRGSKQGKSLLTESDVITIRSLSGILSQTQIGEIYGVAQATISKIIMGGSWSWL